TPAASGRTTSTAQPQTAVSAGTAASTGTAGTTAACELKGVARATADRWRPAPDSQLRARNRRVGRKSSWTAPTPTAAMPGREYPDTASVMADHPVTSATMSPTTATIP